METVLFEIKNNIAYLTLNREDVHNAFDEETIAHLTSHLEKVEVDETVRAVVLKGNGKSFCAGGDLNWMKRSAHFTHDENVADAMTLAKMLFILHTMTKPTICLLHGAVFGGGVGVASACDIAIAEEDTKFCLSEVKLGLVPAVISPYVVRAMGARQMRRYAQTAEIFTAQKAYEIGFVHELVKNKEEAETMLAGILEAILQTAPEASNIAKQIVDVISEASIDDDTLESTAVWIANRRASKEAKEGMNAFLNKEKPSWVKGA